MTPILSIDLYSGNYYPGFKLDLAGMKAAGIRLVWIKAGSGGSNDGVIINGKWFDTVDFFVNYFRAGGFDIGLYLWSDPTQSITAQVMRFLDQANKFKPDVLALDWEQSWSDWGKYWQWIYKQILADQVPQLVPTVILKAATDSLAMLSLYVRAHDLPPISLYTYSWFLRDHCKTEFWPAAWLKNSEPFLAAYFGLAAEHKICETWTEFNQLIADQVVRKSPITFCKGIPAGLGSKTWRGWQIQSGIIMPGAARNLDLSILNCDEAGYAAWLHKDPPRQWNSVLPLEKDSMLEQLAREHKIFP